MKKLMLLALAGLSAGAFAQETGRVISTTPVIQQVQVQRNVCSQQPVAMQPQTSGGGGLVGAIVGGVVGNSIGHGDGRAAATILGTVGGALLGNSIEANGNGTRMATAQTCVPQTFYENRTVGYNVTYEYAGKQYTMQMPYDPGPSVQLQITPVGAGSRPATGNQPLVTAPPIVQADSPAVVAQAPAVIIDQPVSTVVYPSYTYAPRPYYAPYWVAPISFNLGYVYRGGHRHWR